VAVIGGKCCGYGMGRDGKKSGGDYHSRQPGGGVRCIPWKPKIRVGKVRPVAGGYWQGGMDAAWERKKHQHGRWCFFLPIGPRLRPGVVPPPVSR
jgi:hypothetical protein